MDYGRSCVLSMIKGLMLPENRTSSTRNQPQEGLSLFFSFQLLCNAQATTFVPSTLSKQCTVKIMADHADDGDYDGDIFIYRGGRAPQHVTHVLIDKSVDDIEDHAFFNCENLVQVDTHDGIRRIRRYAFCMCRSLRRINIKSAVEIDEEAFCNCENLAEVEFGDRLETIGSNAFNGCTSLAHLKLPSIITIERLAFSRCFGLLDIELSERLETIGSSAFWHCDRLQRIAIPLKRNLFVMNQYSQRYIQFDECYRLTRVDLVEGVHKTVASLHMKSWRTEMIAEINQINRILPNTPANEKGDEIRQWMEYAAGKMDRYKAEHHRYVKEGITLLELALWKAKLDEKEGNSGEGRAKKVKIDAESARKGKRITCGAETVIKDVLPFLQLE